MLRFSVVAGFCAIVTMQATTAAADQCAYVSEAEAQAAQRVVKVGSKVVHFCEKCSDKKPTKPETVKSVRVQRASNDPSAYTLVVNDKEEDFAYLFVQVKADSSDYRNVAKLAKCPVIGVSERVKITEPAAGP